ncbi:toxin-antitoxin system HicB family antitoxin [Pontixanthobacter aestiaquae]|uniref:Toxin-antitoxin system HicB family antitoxin n=1 Tax=Pontixanthobacter aestiaquae TaxID=1509367 RepID=A0A844Z669_9SPHN|nr:toxin-antitoxin system HicB family antitoxin [Pontixanthobacter aestiaquae]MDN3646706.1 toxin-antitoxin system HicB family antitoxin [Pontixanthobacter aestiaquae]MXO82310.1 toxin-antitoxin system HicB family antitoxin [Pontixanthobacter aestiaquae]
MAKPSSKSGKKAFALRLDPAVHSAIERLAAAELRSANAQIEMLLREALEAHGITVQLSLKPKRGRPPQRSKDD